MLREIRTLLMLFCMVCVSGSAYGGFLIELHGGAEIVVNDYWEEEGEIRYSRYGGIVGLPAGAVKDIRPTDRPVDQREHSSRTHGLWPSAPEISEELSISFEAEEQQPPAPGGKSETPAVAVVGVPPDTEEFGQRADRLRYELSVNYRDAEREIKYIEDAGRINDEDAEKTATARLKLLVEEQNRLNSEIELLHGGFLPPWWFEIMEGR